MPGAPAPASPTTRARALYRKLKARARKTSPFKPAPKEERGARTPVWVEPNIGGGSRFPRLDPGGRVRQASFQGLREDKSAKDVVREVKH